jgi:hypothetical protein
LTPGARYVPPVEFGEELPVPIGKAAMASAMLSVRWRLIAAFLSFPLLMRHADHAERLPFFWWGLSST